MKKALRSLVVLSVVVISIFALSSCKNHRKPENLTVDFWKVSWDAVEGATEYVVELDGEEYRTENTYFELFEFLRPDERITVRIEPVFAGDKRKSLWTDEIIYTSESVTEGLVYTDLGDGTYAVSCPEGVVLQNGELVLPDAYENAPIVEFRNAENKMSLGSIQNIDGKPRSDYNGPVATKIQKVRLPRQLETIGTGAFYKAVIEKIHIPKSVIRLDDSSFEECQALEQITGAEGVLAIGDYAFCECSSLSEFTIPNTVGFIGSGAFLGAGITKAVIPQGVKSLFGYTFYNCTALSEIVLPETLETIFPGSLDNTAWYNGQPDGVVYINEFIYSYKGEMPKSTKLVIPDGITKMVYRYAFKNQYNLVSITLPEGFTEIQEAAFFGCKNLSEVIFSEGTTVIQQGAFYGCKSLKEITLPDSLEVIYSGAFSGCGLELLVLPSMLKSIGTNASEYGGAFENCTELVEVFVPKNIERIGNRCFYGCVNLKKITIETGVKNIEYDAFLGCVSLTELTIPDSVTRFDFNSIAYSGITHFVFPKNIEPTKPFYMPMYPDGIQLKYLVIQKGTVYLDYNWFYIYPTLKIFYYEGTKEEYELVEKDLEAYSSWAGATSQKGIEEWAANLTVYFFSQTEPEDEGYYWHYVNGVPAVW